MLTKGQEAFLKSYGSDPRVPEGVHYIRQSIAEDLKITDSQKELLETYE